MKSGSSATAGGYAPSRGRSHQTLFHIGLALGLLHLPLSLEFSITLTHHGALIQSLVLFLYPLALALMGLGAALARVWPGPALGAWPLRVAGAALLVFLWAVLRANFLVNDLASLTWAGVAHAGSLGTWFLALGMALAGTLQRVRGDSARAVGLGWALHLAGIVIGYLATQPAIVHVGPNALLLASGLAFLLLPRRSLLVLPLLLLAVAPTRLEQRLEGLRRLESWEQGQTVGIGAEGNLSDDVTRGLLDQMYSPVYEGWSRYGQVRIVPVGARRLLVLYNLKRQYLFRPYTLRETQSSEELRRRGSTSGTGMIVRTLLYTSFEPSQRLLFSGVGSGRSFTRLPFRPDERVIAVERDPAAARYFSRVQPQDCDHIFEDIDFLIADGRHAIEIQTEPLDAIVMESSRYQPPHSMLPVTTPHYLYTREALATCIEKLAPDGLLAIEFSRTGDSPDHRLVPYQVLESLRALGAPVQVLRSGTLDDLTVFASPTRAGLDAWMARVGAAALPAEVATDWDPRPEPAWVEFQLGDNTPFVGWVSMSDPDRRLLLEVAGGAVALALALVVLLSRWARGGAGWNPIPYFFAVGLGHAIIQFHAFYAWRTFFGDDLLTIIRLIVYFLLYGALGSWLSVRAPRSWLAAGPRTALVAGLFVLHFVGIALIPFEQSQAWLRELYGLVALAPGGLLLGVYFPLGIASASERRVAPGMAADALGTLAGYALMYLIYVPVGALAFAATGVLCYGAATALYRRSD